MPLGSTRNNVFVNNFFFFLKLFQSFCNKRKYQPCTDQTAPGWWTCHRTDPIGLSSRWSPRTCNTPPRSRPSSNLLYSYFFLFHQPSQLQYSTMFTPFEHFGDLSTSFRHIWYSSLGYFLLNTLVFHHPPLEYCGHVGHYEALPKTPTHLSKIQEGVVLVVGKDKYWSGCWQRQRQSKYRDSWRPTHLADKSTK